MASATAPPTPGVDFVEHQRRGRAALGERNLYRQQEADNSPPEATFISGPAREPGLVWTTNSTLSQPSADTSPLSVSTGAENFARSSLSGGSSALTATSNAAAASRRAFDSAAAALP